jgi:hypothetical protein
MTDDLGVRGAAPAAAFHVHCGRCGASFGAGAWDDLALVVHLDDETLSRIVVAPLGASIQVRVCARCGGRIARKVRGV